MSSPRSLGYGTDFMIARFDGWVAERDEYWVVCTPENPGYWWGNFLLFRRPPRVVDVAGWLECFDRELGQRPGIRHVSLAWDTVDGERGHAHGFRERGLEQTESVFMATSVVVEPVHVEAGLEVRPIRDDGEWDLALQNQIDCREPEIPLTSFEPFMRRQFERYRRFVREGRGQWYAAFAGGELVGAMGVLHQGGVARCQTVATSPAHRNRGVARTLVYRACAHALENFPVRTVVILADPEGQAARVYSAVGFQTRERVVSVARGGTSGA